MGQTKTKVIETAIEPEKLKEIEKLEKELPSSDEEKAKPKKGKARERSKRYKELVSLIDKSKEYHLEEAIDLVKKTANIKFDPSVEAHINLGLSAEKTDQTIRTTVTLPHQAGKKLKIVVFTDKEATEIKKLGAEIGSDAVLKKIEEGKIDFDKIISTPSFMPKLAKVAKVLGPKGMMPNPKSGTVSENPSEAVREFSKGKVEVKTEKMPVIHSVIGKAKMDREQLNENLKTLIKAIRDAKPEGFKKELVKSIYLSSTMGPSVKVDPSSI